MNIDFFFFVYLLLLIIIIYFFFKYLVTLYVSDVINPFYNAMWVF